MQKEQFIAIATKISEDIANEEEIALFLFHVNSYNLESSEWENVDPNIKTIIKDAVAENILSSIQTIGVRPAEVVKIKPLWPRVAVAAAVALIVLGVYFFSYRSDRHLDDRRDLLISANDVAPGKQGATLTLASGKKIKLSDAANGEIAKEAGISITKTVDGQLVYELKQTTDNPDKINTLSTTKGETYQLRLPDGSVVWLNSASSLSYSAGLVKAGKRQVELRGEAYFKVTKDKTLPFVVSTSGQNVEVLGTEFNVNSYPDEAAVATTLVEGSVKVAAGNQHQVIKPGEQAISSAKSIHVQKANLENITDWKEGEFYLNHVDFKVAMRKIARWYDVEVIYDESVPSNIESGGWISRDTKLSTILEVIEKSGLVHFKVDGRKVYVTR